MTIIMNSINDNKKQNVKKLWLIILHNGTTTKREILWKVYYCLKCAGRRSDTKFGQFVINTDKWFLKTLDGQNASNRVFMGKCHISIHTWEALLSEWIDGRNQYSRFLLKSWSYTLPSLRKYRCFLGDPLADRSFPHWVDNQRLMATFQDLTFRNFGIKPQPQRCSRRSLK